MKYFPFFVVLEIEFKALLPARQGLYLLSHARSPFAFSFVFLIGSQANFALAGLKP
jgi:hypothetical protein